MLFRSKMSIGKRAIAEFFGTFWLVFGGCESLSDTTMVSKFVRFLRSNRETAGVSRPSRNLALLVLSAISSVMFVLSFVLKKNELGGPRVTAEQWEVI